MNVSVQVDAPQSADVGGSSSRRFQEEDLYNKAVAEDFAKIHELRFVFEGVFSQSWRYPSVSRIIKQWRLQLYQTDVFPS